MTETVSSPPALAEPVPTAPAVVVTRRLPGWLAPAVLALLVLLIVIALVQAWSAQQRVRTLEQELVRRQQDSGRLSGEAQLMARQAQEVARDSAAKVALLEAKLSEVAIQRSQLEDLIQSLSRSRDENVLVDIDAGLRVAQQQAAITGSAEPLVAALKQADERLARYSQPRLDGVRRAIARDIDRVRSVGVADIGGLSIKVDEVVRLVDELPLLSQAEPRRETPKPAASAASVPRPSARSASPVGSTPTPVGGGLAELSDRLGALFDRVWGETRSLVRVSRVDNPDAMWLAPEQAFFLRENLKLRLLNARLAVLSRQFDAAQTDLLSAQQALERYFDRSSRRTTVALELVKQVAAGAHQVVLPRPDDTLAALATATAGR
ncbi:uroporphyrinogen-III C-methyltransferase [Rhizobacter sp. OV335]|uniref:uroporphyrinogen-III C-methyltransferase n=1 Tax=Rhizobacter sp. OV335 TaxID=1500264 RepID=UPI000914C86A|nr:uroporphyrinogen-III C-methyltransferase [Rhizobacter sp. OV335]SHM30404.1 uroporphyrin-3 C-methyltransferase [Rhizobacter sp. OV335]